MINTATHGRIVIQPDWTHNNWFVFIVFCRGLDWAIKSALCFKQILSETLQQCFLHIVPVEPNKTWFPLPSSMKYYWPYQTVLCMEMLRRKTLGKLVLDKVSHDWRAWRIVMIKKWRRLAGFRHSLTKYGFESHLLKTYLLVRFWKNINLSFICLRNQPLGIYNDFF